MSSKRAQVRDRQRPDFQANFASASTDDSQVSLRSNFTGARHGQNPQPEVMSQTTQETISPEDFTIAIICALAEEAEPVLALFDGGVKSPYRARGDPNEYYIGRFAGHNAVLLMPGDTGELDSGMCTQHLHDHFKQIELTLLVGICGAFPECHSTREPIYLGDVILAFNVWRYLHNARMSQLPHGGTTMEFRSLVSGSISQRVKQLEKHMKMRDFRDETAHRSIQHLQYLQRRPGGQQYDYPKNDDNDDDDDETTPDIVFETDVYHRHRSPAFQCVCVHGNMDSCQAAKDASCNDLGCMTGNNPRIRMKDDVDIPRIHVGTMGSADVVLRGRDEHLIDFKNNNVIGADMEGGGVKAAADACVVIKAATDYGDTHKYKTFRLYAAASAASMAKAFLETRHRPVGV
jgi:nucleoside phosphorylase